MESGMIFEIAVVAAMLILIVMIIKSIVDKRKYRLTVKNLFIASALIVFVLIFPQYYLTYEKNIILSFIYSLLFSLKSVTYGQSLDFCLSFVPEHRITYLVYYILTYADYLLMPIFTMSFLIEIFGNFSDKIKLRTMRQNSVVVFSELNDNSIDLAQSLNISKEKRVVFCNFNVKGKKENKLVNEAKKLNAIIISNDSFDLKLKKSLKKAEFYEISSDKDKNIQNLIKITDEYMNKSTEVVINVFAGGRDYERIVESLFDNSVSHNIRIKLIDEIKNSCYRLLYNKPLFEAIENDAISVLVVGAGYTGLEFAKSALWCGQIPNVKLKITVVDKNSKAETIFKNDCPELSTENGYDISFITCNVNDDGFFDVLSNNCSDATYIVVCMNDDNSNISISLKIREYYSRIRLQNHMDLKGPQIWARVRDSEKNNIIAGSSYTKKYNIYPFGSYSEMFNSSNVEGEELDKLSKLVHLSYSLKPNETIETLSDIEKEKYLEPYYLNLYSQRSSFATAVHIKYKFYSIGCSTDLTMYSEKYIEELNQKINENIELLAEIEHQRWMAYIRSEGYVCATIEQYKEYSRETNGNHKYEIAKMHPCLVPWESLDELYKEISSVKGSIDGNDFKTLDKNVCKLVMKLVCYINDNSF